MSENQYPPTKPVCQLDTESLYLHQTEADLDPLAEDGGYLLPAGCVDTEPPEARAGFAARWQPEKNAWQYLPDHRGKTVYRTADGQPVAIDAVGDLPPDTTTSAPPSADHQWDGAAKAWTQPESARAARLAAEKAAKQAIAANMAQAFINQAAELADVPDFEVQTWATQSAEALAWQADNNAATPMLDTIAAARGIERESLIKKALKKAREYRLLTAHVAGRRQAIEAAINAATTLDALDAIQIAYTAPTAPVAIDAAAAQPHDERAQNSAAIEADSGSAAIESSNGSAAIGD